MIPSSLSHVGAIAALLAGAGLAGCASAYHGRLSRPADQGRLALVAPSQPTIRVRARNGDVIAHAGDGDSVRVSIVVERDPQSRLHSCDTSAVTIDMRPSAEQTELVPRGAQGCRVHWNITLPRHSALDVSLDAGAIALSGSRSNSRLATGVGDIEVSDHRGQLTAYSGVGDVTVLAEDVGGPGATLRANVGSVTVRMNGRRLKHSGAPGSGDHLSLGDGTALVLSAGVGDVILDLLQPTPPNR